MSDKTNHFAYLDKVIDKYETDIRAGLDLCMEKYLKANPEIESVHVSIYEDYNDNGYSNYRSVKVEMVAGYEDDPAIISRLGGTDKWDLEEWFSEDIYSDLPPTDLLVTVFGSGWDETWHNLHALSPKGEQDD